MTGYFTAAPRPVTASDAEAARALVLGALGATPYVDHTVQLLADAIGSGAETSGMIVERDGTVAALALFGPVAGSVAWKLDTVLVAPDVQLREIGRDLLDAVAESVREAGSRLLIAEMPADPAVGRTITLLRANRFRQEGRIPDFFRDGVALLFLRREL